MGMYDYINGEQVKCFYSVNWWEGSICLSGGMLTGYGDGAEVPYKTSYYNYGKNFIVFDEYNDCDADFVAHKITDGKVHSSYYGGVDSLDDLFDGIDRVMGYRGEAINISNVSQMYQYIKESKAMFGKIRELSDIHMKEFNEKYVSLSMKNIEKHGDVEDALALHEKCMKRCNNAINPIKKEFSKKWYNSQFDEEMHYAKLLWLIGSDDELKAEDRKSIVDKLEEQELKIPDIKERYLKYMNLN